MDGRPVVDSGPNAEPPELGLDRVAVGDPDREEVVDAFAARVLGQTGGKCRRSSSL